MTSINIRLKESDYSNKTPEDRFSELKKSPIGTVIKPKERFVVSAEIYRQSC